jgi:hypothetical protein
LIGTPNKGCEISTTKLLQTYVNKRGIDDPIIRKLYLQNKIKNRAPKNNLKYASNFHILTAVPPTS